MGKQRVSKLDRSVAGKVVLVTGAASGMGREGARVFAREGLLRLGESGTKDEQPPID